MKIQLRTTIQAHADGHATRYAGVFSITDTRKCLLGFSKRPAARVKDRIGIGP